MMPAHHLMLQQQLADCFQHVCCQLVNGVAGRLVESPVQQTSTQTGAARLSDTHG
jgi:hypothetical protein